MKNKASQFKLYRGIGLREWGYDQEAMDIITEIIRDEVDDTIPLLPVKRKDCHRNDHRKVETPKKVEQVAANQRRRSSPRVIQQQHCYNERRSWNEAD